MGVQFSIQCRRCQCTGELSTNYYQHREHYECPNCGEPMPKETFVELQKGIEGLSRALNKMDEAIEKEIQERNEGASNLEKGFQLVNAACSKQWNE